VKSHITYHSSLERSDKELATIALNKVSGSDVIEILKLAGKDVRDDEDVILLAVNKFKSISIFHPEESHYSTQWEKRISHGSNMSDNVGEEAVSVLVIDSAEYTEIIYSTKNAIKIAEFLVGIYFYNKDDKYKQAFISKLNDPNLESDFNKVLFNNQ